MMKLVNRLAALAAAVLAVTSCLGPMGLPEYGEIVVDLAPHSSARNFSGADTPSFVSQFSLTVEAADIETVTSIAQVDQPQFRVTVLAGPNRTVTLVALNSRGFEVYRGSATVDIEGGVTTPVAITMAVLFSTDFTNFRFLTADNAGLTSAAPSNPAVEYEAIIGDIATTATTNGFSAPVFWFTDLTGLIPQFDLGPGATVTVNGAAQETGVSPQDFSGSLTYTLNTADEESTDYTVTLVPSADMTTLLSDIAAAQTLHDTAVSGTAPGQYPAAEMATFQAAIDAAVDVASDPGTSDTTAAEAALASARASFESQVVLGPSTMVSFDLVAADNPALNTGTYPSLAAGQDATGTIVTTAGSGTIDLLVWWYTDRASLAPQFSVATGATVAVGGADQTSGVTSQDFAASETTPVVYRVTDSTGTSFTDYEVTVRLSADFSPLLDLIQSATAEQTSAVAGSAPGQYPQTAIDDLAIAIATAKTGADAITSSAPDIETARIALDSALTSFYSQRVLGASDFVSFAFNTSENASLIGAPSPYDAISGLAMNTATSFPGTISGTTIAAKVWWFVTPAELQVLIPEFTTGAGATVAVGGVDQTSTVTAQNFDGSDTTPVQYVVTDSTGTVSTTYEVSVYQSADFSLLLGDIDTAEAAHAAALEGTLPGEYPAPAKDDLLAAIASAKNIADTIDATTTEITSAQGALSAALTAFQGKVVGPVISTFDLLSTTTGNETLNSGTYTSLASGQDAIGGITVNGMNGGTVDLMVWWYADTTSLAPTFAVDPATTVSVSGLTQTSGITGVDFSSGSVSYDLTTTNDAGVRSYTVTVSKSADFSPLLNLIQTATAEESSAVAGSAPGQYPQTAIDDLAAAIATAETVAGTITSTATEIEAAGGTLDTALTTFYSQRVLGASDFAGFSFGTAENAPLIGAPTPYDAIAGLAMNTATNFPGTISGTTIEVTLWWFVTLAELQALIPQFTTSTGATVAVGGIDQTSTLSAQDFSGSDTTPVQYVVTDSTGTVSTTYDVSVYQSADFSILLAEIDAAEAAYAAAVEGALPGEYPAPAKDDLLAAIASAKNVADNIAATAVEITTARDSLAGAITAFDGKVVGPVFSTFDLLSLTTGNETLNSATYTSLATGQDSIGGVTDLGSNDGTIDLMVWWYADTTSLVPTFTVGPNTIITVSGFAQSSGVTSQNFSAGGVTYDLASAADAGTRSYTVTVTKSADFSLLLDDLAAAESLYAGSTGGSLPGQYPTSSMTTFQTAIDDAKLVAGAITSDAATILNARNTLATAVSDFQATRIIGASTIDTFQFFGSDEEDGSGLGSASWTTYFPAPQDFTGTNGAVVPSANHYDATVWWYIDLTTMVPSFATTDPAATVEIAGTPQASGASQVDFTGSDVVPVTYRVTEAGGTEYTDYTISVTPSADFSPLLTEIQNAYGLEAAAVEGYNAGEYAPGSKAVLVSAIGTAEGLVDIANIRASATDISTATADLQSAIVNFQNAQVSTADLVVSIDWTAPTDPGISFSGGFASIPSDGSMMITANLAGATGFRWYVDGVDTGDTTATITIDQSRLVSLGTHTVGPHTITAIVAGSDGLEYSAEFDFEMTNANLSDADAVAADAASLAIGYAPGDSPASITKDLTLPTAGPNGTYITWMTSSHMAIEFDGRIMRPQLINGRFTGDITASVSKGAAYQDVTFPNLTVAPLGGQILQDPNIGSTQGFGRIVDSTDAHLVVGVPYDDAGGTDAGKVVIYEWDAAINEWANPYEILGTMPGALFGKAVAIDGEFTVVGAPSYDDPAGAIGNEGQVFVYYRSGPDNTWTTNSLAQIGPDAGGTFDGYASGQFGFAVDISLPHIVVGARDSGGTLPSSPDGSGRAYVFQQVGIGNRWDGPGEVLVARDGLVDVSTANASFGGSVAIDGGLVVVGAFGETVSLTDNAGRAYIYSQYGSINNWMTNSTVAVDATLGPVGPETSAYFGYAVDVHDEGVGWIAVGSAGSTEIGGSTLSAGAVYLFDAAGNYQIAFTPAGGATIGYFGASVKLRMAGDFGEVVVGATQADIAGTNAGYGFVYSNAAGPWAEIARFGKPGGGGNQFGYAIAVTQNGRISVGAMDNTVVGYE